MENLSSYMVDLYQKILQLLSQYSPIVKETLNDMLAQLKSQSETQFSNFLDYTKLFIEHWEIKEKLNYHQETINNKINQIQQENFPQYADTLNHFSTQLDALKDRLSVAQMLFLSYFLAICLYFSLLWTLRAIVKILNLFSKKHLTNFLTNYLPFVRNRIQKDKQRLEEEYTHLFLSQNTKQCLTMPQNGMKIGIIEERLKFWVEQDKKIQDSGKISGCTFQDNKESIKNTIDFSKEFFYHNPLHLNTFPAARQVEAELIHMTSHLFSDNELFGAATAGGTDSILQVIMAYKNKAHQKGIQTPNIVLANTAHAGAYKAAKILNIQVREALPDSRTLQFGAKQAKNLINKNTICVFASAPTSCHMIIDDIPSLSELCSAKDLPLHVDCGLGGYLLPFLDEKNFDFRLKGVTSMSLDNYKYGQSPKGLGIVLFRTRELRRNMYFIQHDWTGGIYATSTTWGSKGAHVIAGGWFAMVYSGIAGYRENAEKVRCAQQTLVKEINNMDQLQILGNPCAAGVSFRFRNKKLNSHCISAYLMQFGWELRCVQFPKAVSFIVTPNNCKNVKWLVSLLGQAVEEVMFVRKIEKDEKKWETGMVKLYQTVEACPDVGAMDELAQVVLDSYFKVKS